LCVLRTEMAWLIRSCTYSGVLMLRVAAAGQNLVSLMHQVTE
jgi:hypothetical protein